MTRRRPAGWGGPLLAAYSAAGTLLRPLLPLLLRRRAARGHEEPARIGERYGRTGIARPDGPLIWVHAASVGETNAVAALVRRLHDAGHSVLFTTVTVTGAATARRALPGPVIHQYLPLDARALVRRFLAHWRPDLAFFVESEVWPVLTDELAHRSITHVIVNARMSERSFARWHKLKGASATVFGNIALALAQTAGDADRLAALGVAKVANVGNLKFDAAPQPATREALSALKAALAGRPVWLAASTHPGEDEVVMAAHRDLVPAHPGLVTIIVPRHPDRGAAIAAMARAGDVAVSLRSAGEAPPATAGLFVADTLGELGLFYRAAPVAFIGGSLVDRGGQNPIEAVRLGAAVLHGPDTPNFAEVYEALDHGAGAILVRDAGGLAAAVDRLLADDDARRRLCKAADRALEPLSGALERTLAALEPLLPMPRVRR